MTQFNCADCGHRVTMFGSPAAANDNGPQRCGRCAWLLTVAPEHRLQLRLWLKARDGLG